MDSKRNSKIFYFSHAQTQPSPPSARIFIVVISLPHLPKASLLHQASVFRDTAQWNMSETNIKQSQAPKTAIT